MMAHLSFYEVPVRAAFVVSCLLGCATDSAHVASTHVGPGPKRPIPADEALHAAPPAELDDDALGRWLTQRLEHARHGIKERVRVPLAARPPFSDGPPFGLAAATSFSDARKVVVRDLTSVGIQIGPNGWLGWVEGRFTGELEDGVPVLEVVRQTHRESSEAPFFRVIAE